MNGPRRLLAGMREAAEHTPARRDRYIDLLRALAIVLVAVGHWLMVVVETGDGIDGGNALADLPWAEPLTWFFQVMPVFFLVGGYSHAASLASHRRKGGDTTGWLLGRTDRLLRPTTLFLCLWWAAAFGAVSLGADPTIVGLAVWAATIPLWFLTAYLAVVLLAPALYALHRRFGAAVPAVLVGLVAVLDLLRLGSGVPVVGEANHLLVWIALHQCGFVLYDHPGAGRPAPWSGLTVLGLALLCALTVFGPYPVSMVDVPGAEMGNASPPSLALLVLGLTQTCLALSLAGPARRLLRAGGPWTAVVGVNTVVLTLFLWHMSAAILAGVLLYGTGLLPQPPVGSAEWLLLRVPWVLGVSAVMIVLLALLGPVEARTGPSGAGRRAGRLRGVGAALKGRTVVVWCALPAAFAGFAWCALAGPGMHGAGALPTAGFVLYLGAAAVLREARRSVARDTGRG
ncbi:acyltransferase [Nocardiopsis sp. HNM0947]|uniref:Acyltransferase n=1 Tax=Nocardiopsis coralli TaxID=2772213 RepID=A0ABR9P7S4_9ACTN|nr:acyltransferase [Nocardiopsis coralli]MBE2999891.1 acyltransferase [Nocardiopsis coralli]